MKPYRHELLTLTEDEVAAAIARDQSEGAAAIEPVAASLARIETTKLANEKRVSAWVSHPDERVPMAMLAKHRESRILTRLAGKRVEPLLRRALRAPEVWTPLLDQISASALGLWPSHVPGLASPEQRLMRLMKWVEKATEAEVLDLLKFEARPVYMTVARHTTVFTPAVVDILMGHTELVPVLAKNPRAPGDLLLKISEWAVEQLGKVESGYRAYNSGNQWLERQGEDIVQAVTGLHGRGDFAFPPDYTRPLIAHVERTPGDAEYRGIPVARWAEKCLWEIKDLAPTEDLVRIVETTEGRFAQIEDILLERASDEPQHRVTVACHTSRPGIRQGLIEQGVWQDPEAASVALKSADAGTLGALMVHAHGTELAEQAFRVLCKHLQPKDGDVTYAHTFRERQFWRVLIDAVTEPRHLHVLYRLMEEDNERVANIIKHPCATPELWTEIAQNTGRPLVRTTLAEWPAIRNVPEVREVLLGSNVFEVIASLALDRIPGEMPDLLSRLADRDPEAALDILEQLPPQTMASFDAKPILGAALTSADAQVRLKAIAVLGLLREAEKETWQPDASEKPEMEDFEPAEAEDGSLLLFPDAQVGRKR